MSKITKVTHVRELNGLELQAVEMALEDGSLAGLSSLVMTLGTENGIPFVAIQRKGEEREVIVHFRDKDKTADERRKHEAKTFASSRKPASKPKPVAKKA